VFRAALSGARLVLSTNIIDASVAALGDGMIWKLQHDKIAGPKSISK
jgi:hypothetical protein